ncbi:MAG TPA: ABC transporter ATP-binding protein [Acidimicrobiales bacterium]|nr:ABC transporter ATP-binding protein [Acidimicrobiales bacterium]
MLEVSNLCAGYDAGEVLHGVSFSVEPGSVVAVVGANGAGKSTALMAISGLLKATQGEVRVDGKLMSGASTDEMVRAGVAHVPEGRQVFTNLTVSDNLVLGAYATREAHHVDRRFEEVLEIFPELRSRLRNYAGSLSGGQQQMLAMGRGLMSDPRYLMLDEPSLGLAPQVTERIFEVIGSLAEQGKGILLVEQNGRLALSVAKQAFLIEKGTITMSGTGHEMLADESVIEHYLGVGSGGAAGFGGREEVLRVALERAMEDRQP